MMISSSICRPQNSNRFVFATILNVLTKQQVNRVDFSLNGLDPKPMPGLVLANAKLKQNIKFRKWETTLGEIA